MTTDGPARRPRERKPEAQRPLSDRVGGVVASLRRLANKRIRDEMGPRYGIWLPDPRKALGVRMAAMQQVAKGCGKSHELAQALWEWGGGWYEVRTVAAFVDEPERVTSTQMDRWCRDFDNWGICDTVCFHLFDRVDRALAFRKVDKWSGRKGEFQKRAAFALVGCLALHSKDAEDGEFVRRLPLIERAAVDERNFVKKGVSWALRGIGRRGPELRAAAAAFARRLAASPETTPRWVGKDALRDLAR